MNDVPLLSSPIEGLAQLLLLRHPAPVLGAALLSVSLWRLE